MSGGLATLRHVILSLRIAAAVTAVILPLTACSSGGDDGAKDRGSTPAATTDGNSGSDVAGSMGDESEGPEASSEATEVKALPLNAGALLGGNAKPTLPAGEPGEVSVVQVGPLKTDSGILLFAFRNNTDEGISHVDWTASARSGGKLVSSGSSQGTIPAQVQPGEVGLSYIYFENADAIPAKSEYEFSASSSKADTSSYNTAPLKVTETNVVGNAIVGGAVNQTGEKTTGPYGVDVYCFKGNKVVDYFSSFAEPGEDLEPGGTVTFTVDLYDNTCASYIVGVRGYFNT